MLLHLLFPPKCILCRQLLSRNETDLCHTCRSEIPEKLKLKRTIPFIAQWTGIWYYKDTVRSSLLRFKFSNRRNYARVYARLLAVRLQQEDFLHKLDLITWVPVSPLRRFKRGYNQAALLAKALASELGLTATKTLQKRRHTLPQSTIKGSAHRRANVMGAYRVINQSQVRGKRILLVDDVLTTGATAEECGKTLTTNGVLEIFLATVAVASHDKSR